MAYITTDTDVACTLTIDKQANGISLSGYPKTYSIIAAFSGYQAITVDEWQKMERPHRESRITAIKSYVERIENAEVDRYQINGVYRESEQEPGIPVENL